MTDEYFMMMALREARKAYDEGEIPVGAVVVADNQVIARGYNMTEKLQDPTAHAEMIALTSAFHQLGAKYLPDLSIYITLEPCLMCTGALYWSKIGRIVWGADDEKNGHKRITGDYSSTQPGSGPGNWPFHPKTELVKGVLKEECARLLTDFFRSRR